MKNIKKWLSGILAILMLITCIPINNINAVTDTDQSNIPEDYEDVDPVDENWQVSLVWYDSSVNEGKTALTSIDWTANTIDTREIRMQITYKNDATIRTYEPGELNIIVGQLGKYNGYYPITQIYAGAAEDGFDWNYSVKNGVITLTNNNEITEKTNFDGSVQITYLVNPNWITSGYNEDFQAIFKTEDTVLQKTNIITFSFNSTKKTHTITQTPTKITSYDGLPEGADKYIWVIWGIRCDASADDLRKVCYVDYVTGETKYNDRDKTYLSQFDTPYFVQTVPDGAIVLDNDFNPLEIVNNQVTLPVISVSESDKINSSTQGYNFNRRIYVGYPIDTYTNAIVENDVNIYGVYWDETDYELLATSEKEIELGGYEIPPGGAGLNYDLYSRMPDENYISLNKILNNKNSPSSYIVYWEASYPGYTYNVDLCNDVVMAPDKDGNYRKLEENEYQINGFTYQGDNSVWNGNNSKIGDYEMNLYIRYENSDEWTLYEDKNGNSVFHTNQRYTFTFDDNVVSWKLCFKNLKETIKTRGYNGISGLAIQLKTDNIGINDTNSSYLVNSYYLQTYDQNGNPLLSGDTDYRLKVNSLGYQGQSRFSATEWSDIQNILKTYDETTYGYTPFRSGIGIGHIYYNVIGAKVDMSVVESNMTNNPISETFTGTYKAYFYISNAGYCGISKGFNQYILLPEGMKFESITDYYPYTSNAAVSNEKFYTINGNKLTTAYIQEHSDYEIINNYKNTNRTFIKITYDFSDDPINMDSVDSASIYFVRNINVSVSYDNYLDFGATWQTSEYLDFIDIDSLNAEINPASFASTSLSDEYDFNDNGDTEERFLYSKNTLTIINAVGSHQDVQAQVQSTVSNYSTGFVDALCNDTYTYKLRIRTGSADTTNIVIYDNLEMSYGKNKHWQGEFQGVDTSYLESRGYIVKVYYSENDNAATLQEDDSWLEYSDNVDKTRVKSLAFEILDSEGNPAVIAAGSSLYVLINMKSPADESIKTLAFNSCWTRWNAIDEITGDIIDYVTGIDSNIVKVALPNSIKKESLPNISINFTKEIIGTDEAFENMNLDKTSSYDFMISLINAETKDSYNGVLNSKGTLTFSNMPAGTYTIEELDSNYFDFVDMIENNYIDEEILIVEGITFQKQDDNYILVISDEILEDTRFNIQVINEIENNHFYEEKEEEMNLFFVNKI